MLKCDKCSFTVDMTRYRFLGDRLMSERRALELHKAVVHGVKVKK